MKKKLQLIGMALGLMVASFGSTAMLSTNTYAAACSNGGSTGSVASGSPADIISQGSCDTQSDTSNQKSLGVQIKIVTNILLFVLGAIAVIMIVIGGIRYATSNGDSSSTKAAKDTILYAVVGLVVAIAAYSIVNFVINQFASK